jgi:hypothetical protein
MGRRFLVDGDEIEVNDQDVDAFMQEVKAAGKKVEAAPTSAPEYAPRRRSALDSIKETATDAALGAAHGASFGFDDDALSLLASEATANDYRLAGQRARERSPIAYLGGDIGGSLLSPVGKIGALGKLGMVGRGAVEGLIEGGLRAYGDTDKSADIGDQLWDTAKGAGLGGAVGGGIGALGKGVRNIMSGDAEKAAEILARDPTATVKADAAGRGASDWLHDKANLNRVAATGVYGAGLKREMQNHGEEAIMQLGRDIEAKGLHQGNAPGGNWNPLNWVGQDARTYADNAGALRRDAGSRMGRYEDQIANLDSPPTVPLDDLTSQLRGKADAGYGSWDPAGTSEGNFASRFADRIEDKSNAVMGPNGQPVSHYADWGDAIQQRRNVDKNINWSRLGGGPEAPMEESIRRYVAGDLRAGTKDALERGVHNGTIPAELNEGWISANNDYRTAAAVQDPAVARVYQEYGNQKVSLPAWIAASSQSDPLRGGLTGMAADFVKYRGASSLAGSQRFLANNAEKIGVAAETATPPVAQRAAGYAGEDSGNQRAQRARGWRNTEATEMLIKRNPSVLGKWGQQLAKAADDDRLGAEILRLQQTDPDFRISVLPQIESLTQESDQ